MFVLFLFLFYFCSLFFVRCYFSGFFCVFFWGAVLGLLFFKLTHLNVWLVLTVCFLIII